MALTVYELVRSSGKSVEIRDCLISPGTESKPWIHDTADFDDHRSNLLSEPEWIARSELAHWSQHLRSIGLSAVGWRDKVGEFQTKISGVGRIAKAGLEINRSGANEPFNFAVEM